MNDGPIIVSAKLSELNAEQLGQLLRMQARQREELVQASQALGCEIDALRARRAELAAQIKRMAADDAYLLALIKQRDAQAELAALAPQGDTGIGDAAAPGVQLDVAVGEG